MCKLVAGYPYHDFWVNHMHYINQQGSNWGRAATANKKRLIWDLHEPNLKIAQLHTRTERKSRNRIQRQLKYIGKLLALKAATADWVAVI